MKETTGFDALMISGADNVRPGPRLVVLMCEPPTTATPTETPTATLTLREGRTPYVAAGDWIAGASLLYLVDLLRRRLVGFGAR